jgi:hypothetical protein
MDRTNSEPEIWEIAVNSDRVNPIITALRKKIIEHFKKGGRVKIIYTDGSQPQELMADFTFKNWKD